MRIGSLFSGIGGLNLAVEAATGGHTIWQVEQSEPCRQVLARHWPEARRFDDVCAVGSGNLPAIDVLCGGFPCQDLSVASQTRSGLKGKRSGLFYEFARIAKEMQPALVVIENVPPLLKHRATIEATMAEAGYVCEWLRCYASSAGAPHLRRRVFVVCRKSDAGFALTQPMIDLGKQALSTWPTPAASNPNEGETIESWLARRDRNIAKRNNGNGQGTPLSIAVRWPTPKNRDYRSGKGTSEDNLPKRMGSRDLPEILRGKLNPDWIETLMGVPVGWTLTTGSSQREWALTLLRYPRWPAGREQEQLPWEPSRLLTGKPIKGRPARVKSLGNAVVPQQALLALSHLLPDATTAVLVCR